MKTCLKYALAILLAFIFTGMHAQIRPGYVFGLNLSTFAMKINGKSYHPETPAGFHFGGSVEIPLNDNFSMQPSFLFSAKGSDYYIDTIGYSISPIYLEVPVNALVSFGTDAVKLFLFGGPYFAVGIGGYKIDPVGGFQDINYGSGNNDDIKPFDMGFNIGIGVNIRGFVISSQYGAGLANIYPFKTSDSEIKNKVFAISLSTKSQGLRAPIGR